MCPPSLGVFNISPAIHFVKVVAEPCTSGSGDCVLRDVRLMPNWVRTSILAKYSLVAFTRARASQKVAS